MEDKQDVPCSGVDLAFEGDECVLFEGRYRRAAEVTLEISKLLDAHKYREAALLLWGHDLSRPHQLGMTTSAKRIWFDDDSMWLELFDGRTLGVPLAWFPRLLHATPEQRQRFEVSVEGIHWEEIDEDISVSGLLAGRGDMSINGT